MAPQPIGLFPPEIPMLRRSFVFAILLGCALASGAYAALPHRLPMTPPTSAELGLVGASASQWDGLRQETITLRNSVREQVKARSDEFATLLDQNQPDLRGFSHSVQQEVDSTLAQARSLQERKLDFYDSLPPAQQAQVRVAMKAELERAQRLRAAVLTLLQDAP